MSKNVKVNDTEYSGVSVVQLLVAGGGTANFKDVDEITTPIGDKTITENGTYDVAAFARAIVNVASGGGSLPVATEEYEVTENADRSLWLNAQGINLVKGVNILLNEKFLYHAEGVTLNQGADTLIAILWDGTACKTSTALASNNTKSHLRALVVVASQYSSFGNLHSFESGNTTAAEVAEDGTLSLTTSATGVTTGNYNNDYIEAGKYYLMQCPSDVVC